MTELTDSLPGEDLVARGLQDLSRGVFSTASLLVLIGAPRLRRLGISISFQKNLPSSPEHALYDHLRGVNARSAHSQYNSLIRRLVSFERALENKKRKS